jgi:4-hydroxybenzoate polyprenyltransferase
MEKKHLSNRQIKAIKLLGMLSLVRWYSIILIALAQYLAAFFVFNPNSPKALLLLDFKLHGIILATAILIAAGYIINAFYDFEKDLVNKPQETIINTVVSSNSSLNIYIALNFLGLLIAFLSSTNIFLFFFGFSFALWFYSHKLQKIAFLREFTASILTVSSFFSIALHFNRLDAHVFVYGSMLFTIILIREFIKEFINQPGDVLYGYNTFLVKYGKKKTKMLINLFITLSLFIPFVYHWVAPADKAIYIIIVQCIALIVSGIVLIKRDSKQNLESLNTFYKFLMVLGILGIPFVS